MSRLARMLSVAALSTALSTLAATPALADTPLRTAVRADMPSLIEIYRDMHAHPELSGQEVQSAARMAREARRAGFTVTENVGGHGVVAVLRNGEGPTVLIRADMDALPVTEQTNLPYASQVRVRTAAGVETGVMHACGHDTHMTAWIGVARQLAANRANWSGTVVMIGQPAEETVNGAQGMIDAGLFTRFPKPDYAIAFHAASNFPSGMIGIASGPALASADAVDIEIHGVGGHGAAPHMTRDPIVLGSRIVTSLQTLVAREVDPIQPAVVTVGSFHAGTKHNIISDSAHLQLTVRAFSEDVRNQLIAGIRRIARGEAIAAGIADDRLPEVTVNEAERTPPTINTPAFSADMKTFLTGQFGAARVVNFPPMTGSEDFGAYANTDPNMKSLIFWVGSVPQTEFDTARREGRALPTNHSPFYAPDADAVISTATEALSAMTMNLLPKR